MSVTRRFILFLGAGIPLVIFASVLPMPIPLVIFGMYNVVLFGMLVADYYLTPPIPMLVIEREKGDKLSHRAANQIAFTIYNPSTHSLRVKAMDTIPDRHFAVHGRDLSHTLQPGEEKVFSYMVTPSKRGAFPFSHIHLKVRGVLGLTVKFHIHSCPIEYKVYPNLKDLSRFRIMMQKNRLLQQGEKTVRLFGAGTEFESLRPYVDGDDYRKMNWMVTARENKLIVNEYQIEKNQPVLMMIDAGRPMSYNVKGYKKLDYAINAALVLSDIVNQKGDQSGLLVFDRAVRTIISPGKGESHRHTIMEALYHIQETRDTSNYENAFRTLCERQKRRGIVFIFTDFETLEEAKELTAHIAMLKRRHYPIVVFMKNEGLQRLENVPDIHVQEVAQNFMAERKQLFRMLNAMSVPNIETEAENFSVATINRYLSLRKV